MALSAEATSLTERTSVSLVGLNLPGVGSIHRSEVRISDNDFMAEFFKITGHYATRNVAASRVIPFNSVKL